MRRGLFLLIIFLVVSSSVSAAKIIIERRITNSPNVTASGAGTADTIPKWENTTHLTDSSIQDSGTQVNFTIEPVFINGSRACSQNNGFCLNSTTGELAGHTHNNISEGDDVVFIDPSVASAIDWEFDNSNPSFPTLSCSSGQCVILSTDILNFQSGGVITTIDTSGNVNLGSASAEYRISSNDMVLNDDGLSFDPGVTGTQTLGVDDALEISTAGTGTTRPLTRVLWRIDQDTPASRTLLSVGHTEAGGASINNDFVVGSLGVTLFESFNGQMDHIGTTGWTFDTDAQRTSTPLFLVNNLGLAAYNITAESNGAAIHTWDTSEAILGITAYEWRINGIESVRIDAGRETFLSNDVTIGNAAAGVDFTLTFDGENSDQVITGREDEDWIEIADDVRIGPSTNAGRLGVGTPPISTASVRTQAVTGDANVQGGNFFVTNNQASGATTFNAIGVITQANIGNTAGLRGSAVGGIFTARMNSNPRDEAFISGEMRGGSFGVDTSGTSFNFTYPLWTAGKFQTAIRSSSSNGTISTVRGVHIVNSMEGGDNTFGSYRGIFLDGSTTTGSRTSITDFDGLYIEDQSNANVTGTARAILVEPHDGISSGPDKFNVVLGGGDWDNSHLEMNSLHLWSNTTHFFLNSSAPGGEGLGEVVCTGANGLCTETGASFADLFVNITGDTMTGDLTVIGNITANGINNISLVQPGNFSNLNATISNAIAGTAVIVPPGFYNITSVINVPDNVTIIGSGVGSIINNPSESSVLANSFVTGDYVTIQGLNFQGIDNGTRPVKIGNHNHILNNYFNNGAIAGVYALNSHFNIIANNHFKQPIYGGTLDDQYGILLTNSNKTTITGNFFEGGKRSIFLLNASYNTVSGNIFNISGSHRGVYINRGSSYNTITGNTFDGGLFHAISIESADSAAEGPLVGNIISANIIRNTDSSGILLKSQNTITRDTIIMGNVIIGGGNGITVDDLIVNGTLITGNIIKDSSTYGIENNGTGTIITNNKVDNSGTTNIQDTGNLTQRSGNILDGTLNQVTVLNGEQMLEINEDDTQDYVKLGDGGDIDINLNDDLYIQASDSSVGIRVGTTPQRHFHLNATMRIEPRSGAPGGPALGDLYVDSDTNELCFYNSTAWVGLVAGGACA